MTDEAETISYEFDEDANLHNTSRKLTIKATYDQLVTLFGEPKKVNSDRVRVAWPISFSDGGVLEVYDWNEFDTPIQNVTHWNVNGHNSMTAGRIYDILAGRPIFDI